MLATSPLTRFYSTVQVPELCVVGCCATQKKKKVRKGSSAKVGIALLPHLHCFLFVAVALLRLLRLPSVGSLLWSRLHVAAKFQLLGHIKNQERPENWINSFAYH